MKALIKKLPKSKLEILFEAPIEDLKKFKEITIKEAGEKIKSDGFRRGKVPKEIVEKEIDQNSVFKEAMEKLIKENYQKAVLENKLEPLGNPEIEITRLPDISAKESEDYFQFKATISIFPEVKLPDYKKIAKGVKRNKILVEEGEVEGALSWLQKSRAKFTLKNKPAEKGDFVQIEFQSSQIENGLKRKDNFILGEGHFIPGFEENLIGMENNQEKYFPLKFPENYFKKEFSGKAVDFKVKVNLVQRVELPEINDNFAKGLGNFENLNSLRVGIKEGLKIEKELEETKRVRQEILEKVAKNSETEIPEILIEAEQDRILKEMKDKVLGTLQMSFEEYSKQVKKTEKEIKDSSFEEAQNRIKQSLVLKEILDKEKIVVSEEEIKNETKKTLKNYPFEKIKDLDLKKLKLYIEEEIRNEKTLQFLEKLAQNI